MSKSKTTTKKTATSKRAKSKVAGKATATQRRAAVAAVRAKDAAANAHAAKPPALKGDIAETVEAVTAPGSNLAKGVTIPTPTKRLKVGRVSAATKANRAELAKQIADLPISQGHIAFGKNGSLYELCFKDFRGSPAVWKVSAAAPLDSDGYRSEAASMLCTGADTVREAIKQATGKTPSQISISLKNDAGDGTTSKPRTKRQRPDGQMSLIDAAAKVLAEAGNTSGGAVMNCKQMVEQITAKGYWSPARGGKTPFATLYSAILRETKTKGTEARFLKADRGQFKLNNK